MQGMNDTITIWNKTIENGKTVYYRHVVSRCYWQAKTIRNVTGSTVSLGSVWTVKIEAQEDYLPYVQWKDIADKTTAFTVNVGDIIAKGEHDDEMTATNATTLYNALKPDVFTIKIVDDKTNDWKLGRHVRVEGV